MNILYNNYFKKLFIIFLIIFIFSYFFNTPSHSLEKNFGELALNHIENLSTSFRISGTKSIIPAQKYIKNEFQKYGYDVIEQNFSWPIEKFSRESKNLIASKTGLNSKQIIIGAHYDSINTNGTDDNASGVAALLELSQKLSKINLPFTIKFIAFDAEEVGLFGSRFFVKNMTDDEIKNTLLYINIDSILTGDNLYIYGDHGDRGWFKNQILNTSTKENINIQTSDGIIPNNENEILILPEECFDYSDHVYFRHANIPFAYFESNNLSSINRETGYPNYRNSKFGMVIHSEQDNFKYIMNNLKTQSKTNLNLCISLIYKTLTNNSSNINITTNISNKNNLKFIEYQLFKNNKLINTFSHDKSNQINISNLKKGNYLIKQINKSNLEFESTFNDYVFEISKNATIPILYEEKSLIPKTKDYDGILMEIYGDNFNDPDTNTDEIYKEFIKLKNLSPKVIYNKLYSLDEMELELNMSNKENTLETFSRTIYSDTNKQLKNLTRTLSTIILTFIYKNIYSLKKQTTLV